MKNERHAGGGRRQFLGLLGAATGGYALLSGCKDDIVGAENVKSPTASSTTPVSVPPAYTANDTDRLNFALQMHYLVASFLQVSLDGTALPASLSTGAGSAGQVTGGRQVTFTDDSLLEVAREVTMATVTRVAYLRRALGTSVTARPAISLASGQGSAFQAIAEPASTTPPKSYYDPFASENDFLLGAVSLSAVLISGMYELAWQMGDSVRDGFARLSAGSAATDSALRNFLFARAAAEKTVTGQVSLFSRASAMASARNPFDGPGGRDQSMGSSRTSPNVNVTDNANWVAIRRSPEQVLGILYTSVTSVPSGGFFPAGVNGTIKVSGANS